MSVRDIGAPERSFGADRELAARVAGRDREAAELMARRLLPVVTRIARAYLGGHADVDDARQTALVDVLQGAGNFEGRGSLEAWAYRIALRSVSRYAKRSRSKASLPSERRTPVLELVGRSKDSVDEALPRPLREYLTELRDVQREAFVLRHGLGHTVPEIAELTGAPIPTVKSRIGKAQAELRRLIRRDLATGKKAPGWRTG